MGQIVITAETLAIIAGIILVLVPLMSFGTSMLVSRSTTKIDMNNLREHVMLIEGGLGAKQDKTLCENVQDHTASLMEQGARERAKLFDSTSKLLVIVSRIEGKMDNYLKQGNGNGKDK